MKKKPLDRCRVIAEAMLGREFRSTEVGLSSGFLNKGDGGDSRGRHTASNEQTANGQGSSDFATSQVATEALKCQRLNVT